jgi:SAM-dependent methyltransferase
MRDIGRTTHLPNGGSVTVSTTINVVRHHRIFEKLWAAAVIAMDRIQGMRTAGNVSLEELGFSEQNRVHYTPSGWQTLRRVSEAIAFSSHDTFVDFGSGKGRVILMAARDYAFKRVTGVEISSALNAVARDNLESNQAKLKCRDVQIVTADALAFDIPNEMTVAYFYSPFTGDVFRNVIDRIKASLPQRSTDRLFIVLLRPVGANDPTGIYADNDTLLKSKSWLQLVKRIPFKSMLGWTAEISIYRAC